MTAGLFELEVATVRSGPLTFSVADAWDVAGLLRREHYLGPIDSGWLVVAGHLDGELVAAQVWRWPTSRHLPADGTWLELSRWCLTGRAGRNAGSRQHAAAVRLIKRLRPAVTTLVSYSDPSQGHTGALYRACNWSWCPTRLRLGRFPSANGKWVDDRVEGVKDRWVFPLARDPRRADVLAFDDPTALATWRREATSVELAWARRSLCAQVREAA